MEAARWIPKMPNVRDREAAIFWKTKMTTHGGPNRNQGRKSLSGGQVGKSPMLCVRMTAEQMDKVKHLGGAAWVRMMIDSAVVPNR